MPNILPALSHCRLCCAFTASLPHLNCLGLDQEISSTSWNFPSCSSLPLWLHPWPLPASFFTFSALTSCIFYLLWHENMAPVSWRGGMERERRRGSWFAQNGKQSSYLFLWAAQEMQWLPWLRALELGSKRRKLFITFASRKSSQNPGFAPWEIQLWITAGPAQLLSPSTVEAHQCCGQEEHGQGPLTISWSLLRFCRNSLSKAMCYRNLWNDFKRAEICRSRSPGKLSFSSPWKGRKLWACISHLTVPRPISR